MALKMHHSIAVHPGEWIKAELVEPHGLNVAQTAEHLHVTRQTMSRLFNAHQDLTAEMAIRFEKAFGVSADTLMRMQTAYDMAQARERTSQLKVDRVAVPA